MKGLLSKSFKRRYNNKKTREDLHKAAEKLGMKMKPQTTQYDPKSEKLDTNRHKADVELINSSVQDIPEAVSIHADMSIQSNNNSFLDTSRSNE